MLSDVQIDIQYYTNCETCSELINEIYIDIMTPNPNTGLCILQTFGFRCTLRCWLQVVTKNYCIHLFKKREDAGQSYSYLNELMNDNAYTLRIDLTEIASEDVDKLLSMMGNLRYREIIRHRYVEELTNEECASLLNMSMANFYNKHMLAKEQFRAVLRKEGLL